LGRSPKVRGISRQILQPHDRAVHKRRSDRFCGRGDGPLRYAGDDPINYSDPFGLDKNPPPLAPNKQPQPQQQPQKHQCSDLERLSKTWHGVETVGTLGVGVGTMLTGGLGLGAACLSGNPLLCFAAAEAAPAFIVGGYYVARSAWSELQEPNNPYFGGDCQ